MPWQYAVVWGGGRVGICSRELGGTGWVARDGVVGRAVWLCDYGMDTGCQGVVCYLKALGAEIVHCFQVRT